MMKLNQLKKIYFLTLLTCSVFFPANAIQRSTADIMTAAAGMMSLVFSYKVWTACDKKIYLHVLCAANVFFVSGIYYCLYTMTPQGRLNKVKQLLEEISENTLIKYPFDTEEAFFSAVYDIYLTNDLPLISAYSNLVELLPKINHVFGIISKISADICQNPLLQEECAIVDAQSEEIFTHISEAIKRIREHKDYLTQLKIYKEFIASEQQFFVQQQIAHSHAHIAQSQQGMAILKWLKAFFLGK